MVGGFLIGVDTFLSCAWAESKPVSTTHAYFSWPGSHVLHKID